MCLLEPGLETRWPMTGEQLTLSGLSRCRTESFSPGSFLTRVGGTSHFQGFR